MSTGTFEFGEFRLDCERFELRRNSVPLRVERKPLELLILLASSGGRLVQRDEIARCLWPSEVFVDTEHGINTAIRKIRYALREDVGRPRFLETVPGKGYRFTGVRVPEQVATPDEQPPAEPVAKTVGPGELSAGYVTPENEQCTTPVGADASASLRRPRVSGRTLWWTASAVAVCLLVLAVVAVARRRADVPKPSRSLDPAAVEAYQHGHYLWFSNHQPASGPYFLKATQLEPDYALAWAGLATFYGAQMAKGELDPRQTLPLEDASAHRADQLDDHLAESHLALAGSYWEVNWDFAAALRELDAAIALDPKLTEAHHLRAKILAEVNRQDEALAEQRLAMQLNPFERPWALSGELLAARRYDEAIAEARSRLEGAKDSRFWWALTEAYSAKGMQQEAEDAREQWLLMAGDTAASQAVHRAFIAGGYRSVLLWMLKDLEAKSKSRYVSPMRFASLHAALGERQQALDALEEAVRQHSPMVLEVQNNFVFDSLHAEPRYRALIHRIGLPPSW